MAIFWHPKAGALPHAGNYIRGRLIMPAMSRSRRQQIWTALWERSGHWEKFRENMFIVNDGRTGRWR